MRSSHAVRPSKALSTFFALILTLGMAPTAALAEPVGDAAASQSTTTDEQAQGNASGNEGNTGNEGNASTNVISSEGDEVPGVEKSRPSNEGEDTVQAGDGSNPAVPAGEMINQEMELNTVVAQAESTRSFFLAQTLESTKTVPMVSAKLPIDTGANDAADAATDEGDGTSQPEGEGDSSGEGDEPEPAVPAVSAESTVVGAFEYLGMTFAIEPGGESVALMAVDYSKLPEEYIQKQVLVIPDTATPDGVDYYSVTRIADDAFAGLTKESANPDYVGCEALFTDEEMLAEAGIDPSEVAEFLSESATTDVAEGGESAGADSQDMPKDEPWAYEDQDQATSEPAIISSVIDLNDDGAAAAAQDGESAAADSDTQAEAEASTDANGAEGNDGSDDSSQHAISSERSESGNPVLS